MRRRILVTLVAMVALAVVALFVPAALSLRDHVERGELLALQREASVVARDVPASGPIDLAAFTPGGTTADDRRIGLYDHSGDLIDGDGPASGDPIVAQAAEGFVDEGFVDGDLVAALPVRVDADGPAYVVRISEPGSESRAAVRRDVLLLGAVAAAIIAAATIAGALLARHLSRPVERLRAWSEGLGSGETTPPPPTTVDELAALSSVLVAADTRVRAAMERERSFSSQVSHQLKTPVAAMRVAIEGEREAPRPDRDAVLLETLGQLDRLEATITSLLALARDTRSEPVTCDVSAAVGAHADLWLPRFAAAGRALRWGGPAVPATVDLVVTGHVLDVLLDNALAHGAGAVTITTGTARRDDGSSVVTIDVADQGSTPAAADPFSELRSDSGHGIGLHLARTLVEVASGQLDLVCATPTRYRLTLPR